MPMRISTSFYEHARSGTNKASNPIEKIRGEHVVRPTLARHVETMRTRAALRVVLGTGRHPRRVYPIRTTDGGGSVVRG